MVAEPRSVPVHPLARKCADAIVVPADGTRSAIPYRALSKLRQMLTARRDDRVIFEHLVVLWMRLTDGGLTLAANQLLDLARIGLDDADIEETVQRNDPQSAAARLLDARTNLGQQQALAARSNSAGVNLRGPRKK